MTGSLMGSVTRVPSSWRRTQRCVMPALHLQQGQQGVSQESRVQVVSAARLSMQAQQQGQTS